MIAMGLRCARLRDTLTRRPNSSDREANQLGGLVDDDISQGGLSEHNSVI